MQADIALIGGTGIGEILAALPGITVHLPTGAGIVRGKLVEESGNRIFVVQRHASGHRTAPHLVRYDALALAVQSLAVRACLSTAAVGSLREDWGPGTMASCHDFIDLSGRQTTLFSQTVCHTDFSQPFGQDAAAALVSCGGAVQTHATYVNGNGPRYETPAEIRMMRNLGGDVVGMTAGSEAIAMREAGIRYACLAVVTNFGCGLAPGRLDHSEVTNVMAANGKRIVQILLEAAKTLIK